MSGGPIHFSGTMLAKSVRLAEALDDGASFCRPCGFAAYEPTPERTAFVRFRAALVSGALEQALSEAVMRQLDALGVVVRTGTLVDATQISIELTTCRPVGIGGRSRFS